MFTTYLYSSCAARKPYHVGLLFTRKNSDLGAISVTERSGAAPILIADRHKSDRFLPLFVAM